MHIQATSGRVLLNIWIFKFFQVLKKYLDFSKNSGMQLRRTDKKHAGKKTGIKTQKGTFFIKIVQSNAG